MKNESAIDRDESHSKSGVKVACGTQNRPVSQRIQSRRSNENSVPGSGNGYRAHCPRGSPVGTEVDLSPKGTGGHALSTPNPR